MRDAQIPPNEYSPKVYRPELIEFWPTDMPLFISRDKVSSGLWLKPPAKASVMQEGEKPRFIEPFVVVDKFSNSSTVQRYSLQSSRAITF